MEQGRSQANEIPGDRRWNGGMQWVINLPDPRIASRHLREARSQGQTKFVGQGQAKPTGSLGICDRTGECSGSLILLIPGPSRVTFEKPEVKAGTCPFIDSCDGGS